MSKVPALFPRKLFPLFFFAISSLQSQNIWMGHDGPKTIFWSARNIRVISKDAKDPVFDLYASLENAAHSETAKASKDEDWAIDWRFHILCSVNGILCVKEESSKTFGGEDAVRSSQFRAYDLDHSKASKLATVRLTDLFPPQQVMDALKKEPHIAAALAESHSSNNLAAMLESEAAPPIKDHDCQFAIRPDFLESFAIHGYANGQTTIHFGIPNIGAECAGEVFELEIQLDTPQPLRAAFEGAATLQDGFLTSGLDHINPGNNPTLISFSHKHKEPKKKKS